MQWVGRMKPKVTLRAALEDPQLLDMGAESWIAWRALLLAMMGEPLLPPVVSTWCCSVFAKPAVSGQNAGTPTLTPPA